MNLLAGPNDAGKRLDHFLQEQLPEYSRSRLQSWVKNGRIQINAAAAKASQLLHGGEVVTVDPGELPSLNAVAEDLPVPVLYQDEDVIAVNKPAGMTVHAGSGCHTGTLVNALVHHFQTLSGVGGPERPGIVHRLDRYTSGVLLVARTDAAHRSLAAQFAGRTVEKTYLALTQGHFTQKTGQIDAPITRDPIRRIRMTTRGGKGRAAHTEYRVLRECSGFTYLEVRIGTGRTHQIRVHLSSIGHSVAGDKLYGAAESPYGPYFLHAHRITFTSPSRGERITVEAPLPPALETWLQAVY